ncbi:MAG: RDD family protein [Candidatus Paceibacterota bacterium]
MARIKLEDGTEINIGDDSFKTSHVPIIDTQYYASPWSRLLAFIIDTLLQLFATVLILSLLPALSREPDVFTYPMVIAAICTVFYFQFSFLFLKNTIGGMIIKIHILNTSMHEVSRFKLLLRSLFLLLFILPINLIFVLPVFFDDKKRTLYDIIFGTVVTKDRIY